jgi:hypothetical protein
MEATVHVQKMRIDHRRKLSHPRAKKYGISLHPSLSISHIRKRSLSRHHQSLPIQVSFLSFFFLFSIEDCFDLMSALRGKRRPIK